MKINAKVTILVGDSERGATISIVDDASGPKPAMTPEPGDLVRHRSWDYREVSCQVLCIHKNSMLTEQPINRHVELWVYYNPSDWLVGYRPPRRVGEAVRHRDYPEDRTGVIVQREGGLAAYFPVTGLEVTDLSRVYRLCWTPEKEDGK